MKTLKILSTPGCAGCLKIKEIIAKVAPDFPNLKVEEISLLDQPELAAEFGIMSAPALVLDDELFFANQPSEKELRAKLSKKI